MNLVRWGLGEEQCLKLKRFVEMIVRWPGNLTGWSEAEVWDKGVRQSLEILSLPVSPRLAVDIGSGAGFPGLVLAIAREETQWTLIDSRRRRTEFLSAVVEELGLGHVRVVAARAEEFIRSEPSVRESVELVTLRAVGSVRMSVELGLPFLGAGGLCVLPRGSRGIVEMEQEQAWIAELGGQWVAPSSGMRSLEEGILTVIRKVRKTPPQYPRKGHRLGK